MIITDKDKARRSAAARKRKFVGNVPAPYARSRRASLIGTLQLGTVEWHLYEFVPDIDTPSFESNVNHGGDWSSWKLIVRPSRAGKANFWITYSYEERRFGRGDHIAAIHEHELI